MLAQRAWAAFVDPQPGLDVNDTAHVCLYGGMLPVADVVTAVTSLVKARAAEKALHIASRVFHPVDVTADYSEAASNTSGGGVSGGVDNRHGSSSAVLPSASPTGHTLPAAANVTNKTEAQAKLMVYVMSSCGPFVQVTARSIAAV